MTTISRERWTVLEPLLDEALDLTPEERTPWLEAISRSAPDVAAELNALLSGEASAERDGFLARPLALTLEGIEIGPYTLEKPLGHGGMGSVWLARRSDGRYEGHAAVKLLSLSLLTTAGQNRFRREGSLLARLTHPGIARLLDAGVSQTGQPYLVLEYVDGQRLDAYADSHNLSHDDRNRLFLRVLEAVGHAHANLIVHRDLKPSNILVTPRGEIKLLDFGIARLVSNELDDSSVLTMEGARAFTPQYAAPEQVRGGAITTATDVYALGVILYQLLSGRHPTTSEGGTPAEVVRSILDVEPPPLAPRDLDSVVRKALRKDVADRYQNVDSFADDLERFLRHEPISVARDRVGRRALKFIRRHRVGVAISAAILAVLVSAIVISLRQTREARRQRDAALTASRRADEQAEVALLLMSQVPDRPIGLREILDRTRNAIEHQFSRDSVFLSSALLQLSAQYAELDVKVRGALLDRAEAIAIAKHDTLRLIEVRCNQGDNLRLNGKRPEADAMLRNASALLTRFPDPDVEATCLLYRAEYENELGNPDKSAPAIHRAIAIRDSIGKTRDLFYMTLLTDLGYTLDRQNRPREAIALKQRVLALMDTTGRGETLTAAVTRHDLAVTFNRVGEVKTAETMLQDALQRVIRIDPGGRIPQQPLIHYAHAALYQGRADSAARYFALLRDGGVADKNTYWEGRALFGLAQAQLMLGNRAAARATIDRFRAISGNPDLKRSDDQVVNVNTLDALVALERGDTATGDKLIHRTLDAYGFYKNKRGNTLHSTLMLASRTALALGRADSALYFAREARKTATRDSLTETRSARVGEARLLEAKAELKLGNRAAASADAQRALAALHSGAGDENPRTREASVLVAHLVAQK